MNETLAVAHFLLSHLTLWMFSLCFPHLRCYSWVYAGCVQNASEGVWWSLPKVRFWCFQAECHSRHHEDGMEPRFLWHRGLGERSQVSWYVVDGGGGAVRIYSCSGDYWSLFWGDINHYRIFKDVRWVNHLKTTWLRTYLCFCWPTCRSVLFRLSC